MATGRDTGGIELADIFGLLLEVSSKWQNIGILLRIEPNRLQGIASECNNNPENCLREMITHWISRGNPSLTALGDALEKLNCHETLQKLKKKYALEATQQELPSEQEEPSCGESISRFTTERSVHPSEPFSVTSFVTNVCPETPKATSTNDEKLFPYLDVCGLSKDEKQDLEAQLLKDTECMIYSFATLVFKSCQSIKQKINPEGLAVCVLALDAFSDAAQVRSPLLKEEEREIRNASTVEKIFLVLKGHWSFINYGILEHIIKSCGTKEDKMNLQEYIHQLKEFCQRRIFEVPPHAYGSESKKQNWTKLTFKLDKKVPTLEDIRETQRLIAKILDLKPSTLYLCCVDEGCVQLLYLIPSFVAEVLFPLSSDQKIAFHDAHILRLDHDELSKGGTLFYPTAANTSPEYQTFKQRYNELSKGGTLFYPTAANTSPEYQTFKQHYDELKTGLDPSSVVDKAFARETPESKTFDELLPLIQTAITMGVPQLAMQAFSMGLITRPQLNTCTHMMYTPDQQANTFLQNIGTKIAADPSALGSFRNILNSDAVYYHVVKKIDESLALHKRAAAMKEKEPAKKSKSKEHA